MREVFTNIDGEVVSKRRYIAEKIDILKDFAIIISKEDERKVREILEGKTTEIQIDNVVHTLATGKATIHEVYNNYTY